MKFDTQAIHRSGTESATHSRRAYNIMAGSRGIARFTESTEYCSNHVTVKREEQNTAHHRRLWDVI
ncbi:hypothetical protein SFRURICE_018402 [Spodoptera frugiperda]|nr:hypothetical protein SFRURICE_018402 [Spodoptera frugiperda]